MTEGSEHPRQPDVPAVRVSGLKKDFKLPLRAGKFRAVDDLSLSVGEGEVYGLIGPNGSGKSTTMKVMLGIVRPTEGSCEVFGMPSTSPKSRHLVGYLPENPYFYKHLTGVETLRFYGELSGLRGIELREKVDQLLEMVGLAEAADRRLGGYSKGMLQRIGLAQAIVNDPKLVILDEPTAGVDPQGSRQIRDLIMDLKSRGITVVLTSHLLEQVQEVCNRIGIISKGRMLREGGLEEMIEMEELTEIVIRNPSKQLIGGIRELVREDADSGAELVRLGHPRTTLEGLYLAETAKGGREAGDKGRREVDQ